MQPEISLRCASCGASIGEPAMFCPECGKALAAVAEVSPDPVPQATTAETSGPAGTPEPSATADEGLTGQSAARLTEEAAEPAVEPLLIKPEPLLDQRRSDAAGEPESKPGARERTRERLHRAGSAASTVARHALDDNVKRVEKIHHVSTAMFEEATYDPSLRFVLVAVGLFLLFVILLVLSKVMG